MYYWTNFYFKNLILKKLTSIQVEANGRNYEQRIF